MLFWSSDDFNNKKKYKGKVDFHKHRTAHTVNTLIPR